MIRVWAFAVSVYARFKADWTPKRILERLSPPPETMCEQRKRAWR